MTPTAVPVVQRSRLLVERRLLGVDAARGVALIGMMAVHIMPALGPDGSATWAYRIAAGRASALFAVLAGLSLVLANDPGRVTATVAAVRRGVRARAGLVAGVGLVLGLLGSGIAIILVHYAVLFVVGTLFLGLRARALLLLGAAWLVVSPVLGHVLRPLVPAGPGPTPSLLSIADPLELVTTLVLTGYYPVLQWTGYLLVGMGLGRLPLRRPAVALVLLVTGTVAAVASKLLSGFLLGPVGGFEQLAAGLPDAARSALETDLQTGLHGTTPTTSWWWLAVSAPHSGTPLDLSHTAGTALAVLGACLLVASALRGRWRVAILPLAATGAMTLTLYTAHVVGLAVVRAVAPSYLALSPGPLLALNVAIAMALATAWQSTGRRGPLESVAYDLSVAARDRPPKDTRPG